MDDAGNALASWTAGDGAAPPQARAARYSTATNTWVGVPLGGAITGKALVAVNAPGDGVIVWNELAFTGLGPAVQLLARRYSAATGTGSPVETLALSLPNAPVAGDVAIDGAGNIVVVWLGTSTIQTIRFVVTAGSWSAVADLSTPIANLAVAPPDLVMSSFGEALVTWTRLSAVEAARWPAGGSAWTAPLSVPTMSADGTRAAVDPAGNAVVVWTTSTGATARQLWAVHDSAARAPGRDRHRSRRARGCSDFRRSSWIRLATRSWCGRSSRRRPLPSRCMPRACRHRPGQGR